VHSNFWTKDSNLLFDYDAGDYQKSSLTVTKAGVIYRRDKNLHFTEKNGLSEDCVKIANYVINNDIYQMDLDAAVTDDDIPWIIIKNTSFSNKNGYRLKVGNMIRFGKSIFRISEINNKEEKNFKKCRDKTLGEHREEHHVNEYTENNANNHTDLGQSNSNVNFIQISKREKKDILVITQDNTKELL
jgi:hypothetical protein